MTSQAFFLSLRCVSHNYLRRLTAHKRLAQIAEREEDGMIQHFRDQQRGNARRFFVGTLVSGRARERTGVAVIRGAFFDNLIG